MAVHKVISGLGRDKEYRKSRSVSSEAC